MDWSLFNRINGFAENTRWAHGFMRDYAKYGVALFAIVLAVAGVVSLRRGAKVLARTVWTVAAPLVALAGNQPIVYTTSIGRPAWVLDGDRVEVT